MTPREMIAFALTYEGDDCLIWTGARTGNGYPKAGIEGRTVGVHNHLCTAEHGPRPDGHEAAHRCGNRFCINRRHLSWKTRAENMQDVVRMGRSNRADRTWTNKLTEHDVRTIRDMAGTKLHREIAQIYGVSTVQITRIINRKSWAWLK